MRKVGIFDKYGSDIEFEESEDSVKLCSAKDRPSSDWKVAVASQV